MKVTISTPLLQNLVSKSVKGASNNKMLPITNLLAIDIKDGKMTLITTDATNYLYVKSPVKTDEDFYAVVPVELFSKLISKLTCEQVTLEVENDLLTVNGNGHYVIELPLDENGKPVIYPNPINDEIKFDEEVEVAYEDIVQILYSARYALATDYDVPCYTGYYVGDKVVATDTYTVCSIDTPIFETPALISHDLMYLIGLCDEEEFTILKNKDTLVCYTDEIDVYGKLMDCIDDYQIDDISALAEEEFESYCILNIADLESVLDRLSLFVSVYDRNEIILTFTENGITIVSKRGNSKDVIPYQRSANFKPFTCSIDISVLQTQLKAYSSDTVQLFYGLDNAIKLKNGEVSQIIALYE